MYGQTEASPRMSYLDWNKFSVKFGSIGKALQGSKFKILDKAGKYIKKSYAIGELIYFGKNVSLGYANNLEDLKILEYYEPKDDLGFVFTNCKNKSKELKNIEHRILMNYPQLSLNH